MKIDTKNATPVKGSPICKLADNPYILVNRNGQEGEDEEYGRELNYVPAVIFTPVLTSKRTPKARSLVSDADVEELSAEISKMIISDEKEKMEETKEDTVEKKSKWVVLDAKDKPLNCEPLGRYEVEVVTNSNAIVRVMRSLRLL
jgi:hypothetical protein